MSEDEDGVQTEVAGAYTEAEILRFTDLVKSVVGYDEDRGDVVTIVSARFEQPQVLEEYSEPWYENTLVTGLIKNAALAAASSANIHHPLLLSALFAVHRFHALFSSATCTFSLTAWAWFKNFTAGTVRSHWLFLLIFHFISWHINLLSGLQLALTLALQ